MYQLLVVARYIHGDTVRPESLVARNRELLVDNDLLRVERTKLTAERQAVIERLQPGRGSGSAAERSRGPHGRLGPAGAAVQRSARLASTRSESRARRIAAGQRRRLPAGVGRGLSVRRLRATEPVSRRHLLRPAADAKDVGPVAVARGPALWFQAAGNTRDQVWNGPLIDTDGTGAFEFAPSRRCRCRRAAGRRSSTSWPGNRRERAAPSTCRRGPASG